MKLLCKSILSIISVQILPICLTSCSNTPKGMPNINIVKHEHVSVTYENPNQKQDFICLYTIETGYSLGEIRVWNKNSNLGEQEITDCITHDKLNKTITIPAAKFWNFEYVKLDINVIKTLKI